MGGRSLLKLRLFLGSAALTWGVSMFGIFTSWELASSALEGLGASPIHYNPMLDYWLRMAAGAFSLIGCWFVMLMIWPHHFKNAIRPAGFLMVVEGIILLGHGLRLSLPPFPFYADVAACLLLGSGIVYFSKAATLLSPNPTNQLPP